MTRAGFGNGMHTEQVDKEIGNYDLANGKVTFWAAAQPRGSTLGCCKAAFSSILGSGTTEKEINYNRDGVLPHLQKKI